MAKKSKNTKIQALRRPKIGIALGSGVARGWAHIGVMKALKEKGIVPDVVVGTSIGAVVGAAHVTGHLDVLETWARSLSKVNFFRFLNFKIRGAGLFGGQKLHNLMVRSFGNMDIENLETPFMAIGCELMTGLTIVRIRPSLEIKFDSRSKTESITDRENLYF